jgi:hypothetical protein
VTTSSSRKSPRAKRQRTEKTFEDRVEDPNDPLFGRELTDREVFLRHELFQFQRNLAITFSLSPRDRKRYAPAWTPEWTAACLNEVLTRAYSTWNDLCNDNCKGMYFCEKKLGHKGRHGCCKQGPNKYGLVWDQEPPPPEKSKRGKKRHGI